MTRTIAARKLSPAQEAIREVEETYYRELTERLADKCRRELLALRQSA